MKAEQHISFLADLLNLINELDTLVKDYCRYLTTDQAWVYGLWNTPSRKALPGGVGGRGHFWRVPT